MREFFSTLKLKQFFDIEGKVRNKIKINKPFMHKAFVLQGVEKTFVNRVPKVNLLIKGTIKIKFVILYGRPTIKGFIREFT